MNIWKNIKNFYEEWANNMADMGIWFDAWINGEDLD